MLIPDYKEDLSGSARKSASYLEWRWPEFYKHLITTYPGEPIPVALYMFYNNIPEHPKCVCGNPLQYRSPKLGFRAFCSIKCATNSKEVQAKSAQTNKERYGGTGFASASLANKAAQTNIERYGVENSMHCEVIKLKLGQTNIERYGTRSALSNPEVKKKVKETQIKRYGGYGLSAKSIKDKATATMIERHGGVGCYSEDSKEKSKRTCLKRYGTEHVSQNPDTIYKIKTSRAVNIQKKYPMIQRIFWQNGAKIYECSCPHPGTCNKCTGRFQIFNEQFYRRMQDGTELCTVLLPYQHPHLSNTSVEVFIKMILDKYNIHYVQNDRNLLDPQEVDFYLPDHKLAIECNGIRWHSSEFKDKHYHNTKFKKCAELGVQLLTIWEDWIINTPQIVQSIILSKIGIIPNQIGARQCNIKQVPAAEAKVFLDTNHIQGACVASIYYGLYKDNELVSLMSFGKKRPTISGETWELVRFCNKCGMGVTGAASKLLKYFIKEHRPTQIISFSSNDISTGNLYKVLGFNNEGTNSSYWYIGRNMKRYHRFSFCKAKLVKMGYDPNKTETEIMRTLPYYRIDDSGQTKWVLKIKEDR